MVDMKDCGVIYVTAGKKFAEAANASAKSLKYFKPTLATHLFSDVMLESGNYFDSFERIENPHLRSKVDYIPRTPFEYTLFLDADTRIVKDISEIFMLLSRFDFVATHAHNRVSTDKLIWREKIPYAFPQLNSGVLLYRNNEKVVRFLEEWREAYHNNSLSKDQITLRELLWLNKSLRLYVLPPEYNVRFRKYSYIWRRNEACVKILHRPDFISANLRVRVRRFYRYVLTLLTG